MTSRAYGSIAVIDSHMDRQRSNNRHHHSDVESAFSSSSRGKPRSHARRDSSDLSRDDPTSKRSIARPKEEPTSKRNRALPPEETTSKRSSSLHPHEPTSKRYSSLPREAITSKGDGTLNLEESTSMRFSTLPKTEITADNTCERQLHIQSKSGLKSHESASNKDVSRRRSSRHYDNDIIDHSSDTSRRHSSRHYDNDIIDHSSDTSRRRSSRHYDNDITDQISDTSRRSYSRHYDTGNTDNKCDTSRRHSSRHYDNDITDNTSDTSRRRSSRHYDNDITDHTNDTSRRRSSRHYDNDINDQADYSERPERRRTDYSSITNLSSMNQKEAEKQRFTSRKENHIGVTSGGRRESSSGRHAGSSSNRPENELRHLSQKDIEYNQDSHSNRAKKDSLSNYPDHSKHCDESSGKNRNPQDKSRISSQIRVHDSDIYVSRDNYSHQFNKGNKVVSRNDRVNDTDNRVDQRDTTNDHVHGSTTRRTSRSETLYNNKDHTFSTSPHQAADRPRDHNHRDGSEVRDKHANQEKDQTTRRRSISTARSENERLSETTNDTSRYTLRSSSKQNLAREEVDTMYKVAESRKSHDICTSQTYHRSEQRHSSEAKFSHRRNSTAPQYDKNTDIVVKSSTSANDMSKTASNSGKTEDSKHHCRSSDHRQSLDSASNIHHNSENIDLSVAGGRRARYPVKEAARPVGSSSSRGRSASPSEDPGDINVSSYKHDNSLSRRSSSSRSNHDTGFASSSSSPKRDESQSRFLSDVASSPHAQEDCARSRVDESRRRRRSRMITGNSLDVPGVSLRKEQSLSSSGRGDSSFEEPYADGVPFAKGNKQNKEETYNRRASRDNEEVVTASSNRGPKHERRDSKLSDISVTDNLNVSKNTGRGSANITKCRNDFPIPLSKAELAEMSSSTSTLREGNITSKTSISDSISSLLGRSNLYQQFRSSQPGGTSAPISISDKWRKLKEGILPDKDIMLESLKEKKATTIFYAAAARFMNSLSGVQNTLSKSMPAPPSSASPTSQLQQNEIVSSLTKTEDNSVSNVTLDSTVITLDNSPMQVKAEKAPSSHSISALDIPNGVASQRPSIISTTGTLSTHNKRINAYALMTEKNASPGSEASGETTPPLLDAEMKRRSKEMDSELTSFLPAEMSKREEKFHQAARVNDTAAIRCLLKEKVNINCRNSLDRTALHWAAANGNLEAAEVLIENGADLEAKDKYGMRAVLWAAWFGHISVLKALINAGANIQATNKQGLGMLHCAAENNHVTVISFIFEALEHYDVNHKDKNERTPLHSAAEGGHVEAVNRLLEAKADLHKKDKGGMTAVHLAAKFGHIEVLKALLLQGVEVDDRDVDGKTALHLAAETGHKEAVDLLLDYTANPNSETVKEITPLHLVAQEGHAEVCRSLVKYGINVNARNFQGNTALHIAANGNHKEVARILIDAKCELDLPNNRMQTPLHVAVENGHLDVVQVLLAGGSSLDTREKSGKSALQLAARGNFVAVVDMLIKAERYYANAREYHDKDVGYVDPDTYLRNPQHPHAAHMKDIFWKLAMKQLKPTDWKKLAYYWRFTPEHVKAIEQEYTGTASYKEHSYRLLNIWLHGVRKDENVLKLLFEALVAIDKKQLAETVRRKVNTEAEKPCSPSLCFVS